jgi:ABC-type phosphate transport system substrate-binding protein
MERTALITAAAVTAALAVAGCGSSSSSSPAPAKTPTVAPVVQTAQQAGTGDYNMATLASEFAARYNSQPGAQFDSGSVRCMLTGPQLAQCMGTITGTGGTSHGQTVQITQDGSDWMSLDH